MSAHVAPAHAAGPGLTFDELAHLVRSTPFGAPAYTAIRAGRQWSVEAQWHDANGGLVAMLHLWADGRLRWAWQGWCGRGLPVSRVSGTGPTVEDVGRIVGALRGAATRKAG